MEIFVARQPVFTADREVFGYELLFRLGLENSFPDIDGDTATSNLLSNTFFSFELEEILSGKPGLINFTRNLILKRTPLIFPKEHIIIEVLEDIDPEPEIIDALTEFRRKGFRIALDDFVYDKKFDRMISLCQIIKFDLMATPLDTLEPVFKEIKADHSIALLAEKVETHEEFEQAKEMGFTLFQGYFFSKPEILSQKDVTPGQTTQLKLLNELGRAELDFKKIEDLIKQDISISFKLLKFINSAYFSRPSPIDTIKDSMVLLGETELKKFINVAVVSNLNPAKPNELTRASVIRARMCEQCGAHMNTRFSTEELFTIGLFSSMDAIMDMTMEKILDSISLSEKIKDALLGRDKQYKQINALVDSIEKGKWDSRLLKLIEGRAIMEKLPGFYRDAIKMADAMFI